MALDGLLADRQPGGDAGVFVSRVQALEELEDAPRLKSMA